jgi:hypothetical protein
LSCESPGIIARLPGGKKYIYNQQQEESEDCKSGTLWVTIPMSVSGGYAFRDR